MYREITVDRSLLFINQSYVDMFVKLAKKYEPFNDLVTEAALNKKDAWIIAFNIWLLLLPDNRHIIHSAEKTLYYSSHFIILDSLQKNVYFNQFKLREHRPELLFYIAALILASGLNNWIYYVMEKYHLTEVAERNKTRIYFEGHRGNEDEVQLFLEDESKFVKVAVKELHSTDTFDQMIKKCIDEAYKLYRDDENKNEPFPH